MAEDYEKYLALQSFLEIIETSKENFLQNNKVSKLYLNKYLDRVIETLLLEDDPSFFEDFNITKEELKESTQKRRREIIKNTFDKILTQENNKAEAENKVDKDTPPQTLSEEEQNLTLTIIEEAPSTQKEEENTNTPPKSQDYCTIDVGSMACKSLYYINNERTWGGNKKYNSKRNYVKEVIEQTLRSITEAVDIEIPIENINIVATARLRHLPPKKQQECLNRIKSECKKQWGKAPKFEIINQEREAELAAKGSVSRIHPKSDHLIIIDSGGQSTEISCVKYNQTDGSVKVIKTALMKINISRLDEKIYKDVISNAIQELSLKGFEDAEVIASGDLIHSFKQKGDPKNAGYDHANGRFKKGSSFKKGLEWIIEFKKQQEKLPPEQRKSVYGYERALVIQEILSQLKISDNTIIRGTIDGVKEGLMLETINEHRGTNITKFNEEPYQTPNNNENKDSEQSHTENKNTKSLKDWCNENKKLLIFITTKKELTENAQITQEDFNKLKKEFEDSQNNNNDEEQKPEEDKPENNPEDKKESEDKEEDKPQRKEWETKTVKTWENFAQNNDQEITTQVDESGNIYINSKDKNGKGQVEIHQTSPNHFKMICDAKEPDNEKYFEQKVLDGIADGMKYINLSTTKNSPEFNALFEKYAKKHGLIIYIDNDLQKDTENKNQDPTPKKQLTKEEKEEALARIEKLKEHREEIEDQYKEDKNTIKEAIGKGAEFNYDNKNKTYTIKTPLPDEEENKKLANALTKWSEFKNSRSL